MTLDRMKRGNSTPWTEYGDCDSEKLLHCVQFLQMINTHNELCSRNYLKTLITTQRKSGYRHEEPEGRGRRVQESRYQ